MVSSRYAARSTMVWAFDEDELDCSDSLLAALPEGTTTAGRADLRGAHLSPVAFSISPSEIDPLLGSVLGAQGVRTLSLGDAAAIDEIVEAVVAWLWPKELARPKVLGAAAERSEETIDV
eukprot:5515467-Prymnesium_polylepis.1